MVSCRCYIYFSPISIIDGFDLKPWTKTRSAGIEYPPNHIYEGGGWILLIKIHADLPDDQDGCHQVVSRLENLMWSRNCRKWVFRKTTEKRGLDSKLELSRTSNGIHWIQLQDPCDPFGWVSRSKTTTKFMGWCSPITPVRNNIDLMHHTNL